MLEYLKIMEDKRIVIFITPRIVIEKIKAKYRGFVNEIFEMRLEKDSKQLLILLILKGQKN